MHLLTNTHRSRLRVELLEDRAVPSTLLVDDDKAQFKNAAFTTIQAAVNAAKAGDTILVAKGTYTEQVTFAADKDDISLRAQGSQVVIQAPAALAGSIHAIVTVSGADGVSVRGFTITGPAKTANDLDYGVAIDGGSATVADNTITKIRNNPRNGAQTGVGVVVLGDQSKAAAVIRDNTITDYQKGGVVVFGAGATALVDDNTIAGAGPTAAIAQNGIQVSDGASAVIRDNSVRGNVYTGSDATADATGVLVDTAGTVSVFGNRVFGNDVGVLSLATGGVVISDNRVFSNAQNGISVGGAAGGLVFDNRVEDNGRTGIAVGGGSAGVLVIGNRVRGNGEYGISLFGAGTANNLISGNDARGNDLFDGFDGTTGGLTAGTANLWFGNRLGTKSPNGLK